MGPMACVLEHPGVEGLHPLARQRPRVLDPLLADAAELGVGRRVVHARRPRVQDATRPNVLQVLGILLPGIIQLLRLLFRVQVMEVAEPFVESVHRGQELVAIAEVALAELRGVVAGALQHLGLPAGRGHAQQDERVEAVP